MTLLRLKNHALLAMSWAAKGLARNPLGINYHKWSHCHIVQETDQLLSLVSCPLTSIPQRADRGPICLGIVFQEEPRKGYKGMILDPGCGIVGYHYMGGGIQSKKTFLGVIVCCDDICLLLIQCLEGNTTPIVEDSRGKKGIVIPNYQPEGFRGRCKSCYCHQKYWQNSRGRIVWGHYELCHIPSKPGLYCWRMQPIPELCLAINMVLFVKSARVLNKIPCLCEILRLPRKVEITKTIAAFLKLASLFFFKNSE